MKAIERNIWIFSHLTKSILLYLFEVYVMVHLHYNFLDNFFNSRKIWFHVNGVNNRSITLCIFPTISFWCQSIFFPWLFWKQNWLGFKKILGIKVLDKSIVSKKRWKRNKRKPTSQPNKSYGKHENMGNKYGNFNINRQVYNEKHDYQKKI